MSFFSKNRDRSFCVTISVGSRSVAGAIIQISDNEKPKIFFATREHLEFQQNIDSGRMQTLAMNALKTVSRTLRNAGMKTVANEIGAEPAIRGAHIFFSPSWCVSESKIVNMGDGKAFKFTDNTISMALSGMEREFENEISAGDAKNSAECIEKKITRVKLNGYEIGDPAGKTAETAELDMFVSLVPKSALESAKEAVREFWPRLEISAHSQALANFTALRDIFRQADDFLILDVSGEITEISLVKNGAMSGSVSFPLGRNFIIRWLSGGLKSAPEICLSSLSLYMQNKMNAESRSRIASIVSKCEAEWISSVANSLSQISSEKLPTKIFLTAEKGIEPFFQNALAGKDWSYATWNGANFEIQPILPEILANFADVSYFAEKNPVLMIQSIYLSKIISVKK